jgi:hypothetical protein
MLPRAIRGRTAAGEPVDVVVMDSEGLGATEQVHLVAAAAHMSSHACLFLTD